MQVNIVGRNVIHSYVLQIDVNHAIFFKATLIYNINNVL